MYREKRTTTGIYPFQVAFIQEGVKKGEKEEMLKKRGVSEKARRGGGGGGGGANLSEGQPDVRKQHG